MIRDLISLPEKISGTDLAQTIADLPVSAIMIHARSYEQPFDGTPRWDVVNEIKSVFPGIVLANGGITSPEIAKKILSDTGADGLGIARGAWGKPWIFEQIKNFLKTNKYSTPQWDEVIRIIIQHAEFALEHKGPHGLIELRKHLSWYVKGLPDAKKLRQQLVQVQHLEEIKTILNRRPASPKA